MTDYPDELIEEDDEEPRDLSGLRRLMQRPSPFTPPVRRSDDEVRALRKEVKALRAALATEIYYRTLGGTPHTPDREWANQLLEPPPSASDPAAPPHRRVEMQRSDERAE